MTSVHWVIQENQGDSDMVRRLAQAVEREGHVAHMVPLTRSLDVPPIAGLPERGPVVCHGPGFVTRAPGHPQLRTGLFFDVATFRWAAFRAGWGDAMLSADGRVMPLWQAREFLKAGSEAFVRPDADSKVFEGGVYDADRFAVAVGSAVSDETVVVVASPVEVEAEWRFFVVDREIVGCSEYRRWGQPSTEGAVPRAAIELATNLVERWSPADVYCLDLAESGGRIGVVEANCFNAARFYGAVMDRIVRAVNAYVLSRH